MKVFITRPIPESGIKLLKDKGNEVIINSKAMDRPAEDKELIEGVCGAAGPPPR